MQQTQIFDLRRPRDLGALVTLTFDFIRVHFRPLGRAVLFLAGPFIAALAVISGVVLVDMLDVSQFDYDPETTSDPALVSQFVDMLGGFAATIILSIIVTSILLAVVNAYIVIYAERRGDGEITVADVRERVMSDLGIVISTLFMTTILTVLGMFLLFVPGIYLSVALSIALAVRTVERKGLFESFSRSFSLISGHWWMTFGLMLVMLIINSFIGMVFAIPQYIVMGITAVTGIEGEPSPAMHLFLVITTIIQTFGSNLLTSLLVTALTFNYFNLVERKEGVGSRERIDQIGATRDADVF